MQEIIFSSSKIRTNFILPTIIGFIAILFAILINKNPINGFALFVLIIATIIIAGKANYVLCFLVIVMTNFLGLLQYSEWMPNVTLPVGGQLNTQDIAFILALFPLLTKIYQKRTNLKKVPLNKPLLFFFLLVLLEILRAIILQNVSIRALGRVVRMPTYYLTFFIVLYSIKNKKQLNNLLKLLFLIGLLAGFIGTIQYIFGFNFGPGASELRFSESLGIYRTYNSAIPLIVAAFLTMFATYPYLKHIFNKSMSIVLVVILILPIIFTLARSTWISVIIALLVILLLNGKQARKILVSFSIAAFVLMIIILMINSDFISNYLNIIQQRFYTSLIDVSQQSGTWAGRLAILEYKWNFAKNKSFAFGAGLDPGNIDNPDPLFNPYSNTADSGLANIALRFGIIGIFIYGWLFFAFFKRAVYIMRTIIPSLYRSIVIAMFSLNIEILIVSVAGDHFFHSSGILAITFSWALTELIFEYYVCNRDTKFETL